MTQRLTLFLKKHLKILSISLCCLSLLSIIYCLKQLTSFNYTIVPPPVLEKNKPVLKANKPLKQLKDLPVFGNYLPKEHNIPNTLLDLKLLGILKSSQPKNSQVIIKLSNNKEKLFHLNDVLPGNAKIIRIDDNHILINRNGSVEQLVLDKQKLIFDKPLPPMDVNNHDS